MDNLVRSFARIVTCASIMALCCTSPSKADVYTPPIGPEVIGVPKSPVTLYSCSETHGDDNPQWTIDASWKANAKTITAIKLRVLTENAFGDILQTDDLAPTGTYSANAMSSDSWTVGDLHMPARANVSKVRCEIVAAIFQDGSTWNAPSINSPKSSPRPQQKTPTSLAPISNAQLSVSTVPANPMLLWKCKAYNDAYDANKVASYCSELAASFESSASQETGGVRNRLRGFQATALAYAGAGNVLLGDHVLGHQQLQKAIDILEELTQVVGDPADNAKYQALHDTLVRGLK